MKKIYLDTAATTPLSEKAFGAMLPFFKDAFYNASAAYSDAGKVARALREFRSRVAGILNAQASEIIFTSGASESNNTAIKGVFAKIFRSKKHFVTTAIEHESVLKTAEYLGTFGIETTYLPVDSSGRISLSDLKKSIRNDTALVSIMLVNNEIGTIEPVEEAAEICRERGVLLHTDATQGIGHLAIDVKKLGVDFLSLSAHKFHGPKGSGLLYVKSGSSSGSLVHGGPQESGRRAGTENLPGIAGLTSALEDCARAYAEKGEELRKMQNKFVRSLYQIEGLEFNGSLEERILGNLNFRIGGKSPVNGESLRIMLENRGILVSKGSACNTGADSPSHVLLALGKSAEEAKNSIRISFDLTTRNEDISEAASIIAESAEFLRHERIFA
jgi:cysteine desulfurase